MVKDPNQGFRSPIKQEISQTKITYSLESSKTSKFSQIPKLSKELKRANNSKNLQEPGSLTTSDSNLIFSQIFGEEIPFKRVDLSSNENQVAENIFLLMYDTKEISSNEKEQEVSVKDEVNREKYICYLQIRSMRKMRIK